MSPYSFFYFPVRLQLPDSFTWLHTCSQGITTIFVLLYWYNTDFYLYNKHFSNSNSFIQFSSFGHWYYLFPCYYFIFFKVMTDVPDDPGECVEGPGEEFRLLWDARVGGCVLAEM